MLGLSARPEVVRIAQKLGCSRREVVGCLIDLWSWFPGQSTDGHVPLALADIADVLALPVDFLEALRDVHWLEEDASGTRTPHWDEWLSPRAKIRLRDARRKRLSRAALANGNAVRKLSTNGHENGTPRHKSSHASHAAEINWQAVSFPPDCDTAEVRTAITEWLEYRRRIAKPYKLPEKQISALLERYGQEFPAAVRFSIAQGYQGCFAPTGGSNGRDNSARYRYDPNRNIEPL